MRTKRGVLFMLAGALLLAGAVGLTLANLHEDEQAEARAQAVSQIMEEQVIAPVSEPLAAVETAATSTVKDEQVVQIDAKDYIGVLEIPALSLELPIQQEWSSARLRTSPCRYTGSFLTDNMIIAGHNYKRHFGGLAKLQSGDAVFFTDVTGAVYEYTVSGIETLDGSDTEGMVSGDWDLTLFTCTYGGRSRVTVRCDRVETA